MTALSRIAARLCPGELGRKGAVAVEYAILVPAFVVIVLGSIDVGRLVFTQVSLERAVQAAARCRAVNSACASDASVKTYAAEEAWGVSVDSSNFAVATASCGVQVSASLPYELVTPWMPSPVRTLTASACYPVNPTS